MNKIRNEEVELDNEILLEVGLLEACFLEGDNSALLMALLCCCDLQHTGMPKWVAENTITALEAWARFREKTLDDAFDVNKPKGFNLNANKKRVDTTWELCQRVEDLSQKGVPIDEGIFEQVGRELKISGSQAKKYYYEAQKFIRHDLKMEQKGLIDLEGQCVPYTPKNSTKS